MTVPASSPRPLSEIPPSVKQERFGQFEFIAVVGAPAQCRFLEVLDRYEYVDGHTPVRESHDFLGMFNLCETCGLPSFGAPDTPHGDVHHDVECKGPECVPDAA